ncbi:MAG: STAS domain-containing protein [Kistimonas sp.]|nr:STAS domain-containing protein [Kistimonas sp.]
MRFSNRQDSGKTVVEVTQARLDASLAQPFRDYLFELIEQGETDLVIDLSQVDFMDSSGLGVIVAALKKVSAQGSIALAEPSKAVNDLFDLTCMDKLFPIHTSVAAALGGLSGE